MGGNLNPVMRRELENLDKDADSRKSAMKALKSYVKDLDSKAIPMFLAQVSETKETGLTSGEYTISLFEVLARVHGTKIVPQIDNIMMTIIKTLNSSAGSFALHQACAKVVPAVARYGMDPTTPEFKKREIVYALCKPLSDSLLASQENLSSGAALCLRGLVESDNWRFASSEMVNEVCQRVAAALEKVMQSTSHMDLVMALAKHNGLVVEDYARLLIRSGVEILKMGFVERNSQKRLSAIHMVNYLMRSLDYKCIMSELTFVIEEMEKCQNDQMAYVKRAAFEAIQTAKRVLIEKRSRHERSRRDLSPFTGSVTMESYGDNNSISYSPFSISFASRDSDSDSRSINRKLWSNVDVSLKDGLFSGEMSTPRSVIESSENQGDYEDGFSGFLQSSGNSRSPSESVVENSDTQRDYEDGFLSLSQESPANGYLKTPTRSPQRSRSYVNVDNMNLFTTPRKLVKSLQVQNDDSPENQSRRFSSSSNYNWSPNSNNDPNGVYSDLSESYTDKEHLNGIRESVSSTGDISLNGNNNSQLSTELVPVVAKAKYQIPAAAISIASGLFVLLIAVVCFLWVRDSDEGYDKNLVPT